MMQIQGLQLSWIRRKEIWRWILAAGIGNYPPDCARKLRFPGRDADWYRLAHTQWRRSWRLLRWCWWRRCRRRHGRYPVGT